MTIIYCINYQPLTLHFPYDSNHIQLFTLSCRLSADPRRQPLAGNGWDVKSVMSGTRYHLLGRPYDVHFTNKHQLTITAKSHGYIRRHAQFVTIYIIHIDVCVCFVIPPYVLVSPKSLNHICKNTKSQVVRVVDGGEWSGLPNKHRPQHSPTQLHRWTQQAHHNHHHHHHHHHHHLKMLGKSSKTFSPKWWFTMVQSVKETKSPSTNPSHLPSSSSTSSSLIIPMNILCFPAKTQLTRCQNGVALCHWDLRFLLAPAELIGTEIHGTGKHAKSYPSSHTPGSEKWDASNSMVAFQTQPFSTEPWWWEKE